MLLAAQLFLGFCLLIGGAELLVRGAGRISLILGISPLIVGLTVVAYGTSAPELAVNLSAIYETPPRPGLVVGNVVGSNISNILFILGITAIVIPLIVDRRMVVTTLPFMVLVSFSVLAVGYDGLVSRLEGMVMFVASLLYSAVLVYRGSRRRKKYQVENPTHGGPIYRDVLWNTVLLLAGLAILVYGADVLVDACVEIATILAVSELVIGLSIVAIGTSLPELATSIVACLQGKRELAVGNLIGSNIFNILLVLGLCSALSPAGVAVEAHAIEFDIVLMIAVAVACLPIFASGYEVTRWEGALLLAYYAAYIGYLFLSYAGDATSPRGEVTLYYWIVPLAVVAILSVLYRLVRRTLRSQS